MSLLKSKYLIVASLISIVGFCIPFTLKEQSESWNSVISSAFTIFSTILSVITLIVAILLFDRFGITGKFKEKQADRVIELAEFLKSTNITATAKGLRYFVHATQSSEEIRNSFPRYREDSNKTILFPENFESLIKNLYIIRDNHWFPKEIKDKMKIFEIYGGVVVDNPEDDKYVRLDFNDGGNGVWMETIPKITFEMLNTNLHNLFIELEAWLKKHSDIIPNFKFRL